MDLTLQLPEDDDRVAITGVAERNLKIIRESLGVTIQSRDSALKISGAPEAVEQAAQVLDQLGAAARRQKPLSRQELLETITLRALRNPARTEGVRAGAAVPESLDAGLEVYLRGRRIRAMTSGQQQYLRGIFEHDMSFCCGPAGTGKTYLAVAAAVYLLRVGAVRRIVLVRPAVEAGEKLGFLPGNMQEKVNPYLRPLLDALHDMMEFDQIQRFMATDVIEIIPLAFMRGRTLNDAMVILDEAQNTTRSQMLMFLTRLGHGSKMVITGDTSQIDLPNRAESGLIDAVRRLRRTRGVAFAALGQADIVRHSLVQRIVEAYEDHGRTPAERSPDPGPDGREETDRPA